MHRADECSVGKAASVRCVRRYDMNMRFRSALLLVSALAGTFALPSATHAAIPFFDPIIPSAINLCPASWGMVIDVINNLISFLITIAVVFVAPIMIAYAGFLLVVNPFNPGAQSTARKILLNIVIGIVVALAGWLIVDAVMAVLYHPSDSTWGTWSSLITSGGINPCLIQEGSLGQFKEGSGYVGSITGSTPTTPVTTTGGGGGAGSCTVPTSGPCSPSNLSAFGNASSQAAEICTAESGGVTDKASATDKMSYDGRVFSWGLFQINLTVHSMAGLNCPSAFSGTDYGARVINESLYAQCVAAAEIASNNIAEAVATYNSSWNWSAWSTARECGLSFAGEEKSMLALLCDRGTLFTNSTSP